jgi:hypothetical protein
MDACVVLRRARVAGNQRSSFFILPKERSNAGKITGCQKLTLKDQFLHPAFSSRFGGTAKANFVSVLDT